MIVTDVYTKTNKFGEMLAQLVANDPSCKAVTDNKTDYPVKYETLISVYWSWN